MEDYRRAGKSVLEVAYKKTKDKLWNLGSTLYSGYSYLFDLMNPDQD